ncbi:hypothetical protein NEUTE2DRAFT_84988, partial [Neurospora tetrasperma FGSC 2509]
MRSFLLCLLLTYENMEPSANLTPTTTRKVPDMNDLQAYTNMRSKEARHMGKAGTRKAWRSMREAT